MARMAVTTLALTALLSTPAAWCQADSTSAGATGASSHSNQAATFDNDGVPINSAPFIHQDTPGKNGGHSELVQEGWSDYTNSQGAGAPNGPRLFGTNSYSARRNSGPADSGAATSAPFPGTFVAPGNLALRAMGLRELPQTRLGSLVFDSNYDDEMFGNEGSNGPPPYSDFHVMDPAWNKKMTTGHRSDAPSSWNWPE